MEPLITLTSIVAPLPKDNVDTDAIIPAEYLRSLSTDPATGLFARWRYRDDGSPDPDFVLNDPRYRGARTLLSGANFGCGSSRENAVWAVKPDSPIKSIKDFKGRKIAYTNPKSTSQALANLLLDLGGYKAGEVELVKTGGFGEGVAE